MIVEVSNQKPASKSRYGRYFLSIEAPEDEMGMGAPIDNTDVNNPMEAPGYGEQKVAPVPKRNTKIINIKPRNNSSYFSKGAEDDDPEDDDPYNSPDIVNSDANGWTTTPMANNQDMSGQSVMNDATQPPPDQNMVANPIDTSNTTQIDNTEPPVQGQDQNMGQTPMDAAGNPMPPATPDDNGMVDPTSPTVSTIDTSNPAQPDLGNQNPSPDFTAGSDTDAPEDIADQNAQNPDPNAANPDPNAQNPDMANQDPNAQNPDGTNPDQNADDGEGPDTGGEGDDDFSDGAEDDDGLDDTSTTDDASTDGDKKGPGLEYDSTRKYNLFQNFMKLLNGIDNYIERLEGSMNDDYELNKVIKAVIDKLRELRELTYDYLTMKFEISTYIQSLLFYQNQIIMVQLAFDVLEKGKKISKKSIESKK